MTYVRVRFGRRSELVRVRGTSDSILSIRTTTNMYRTDNIQKRIHYFDSNTTDSSILYLTFGAHGYDSLSGTIIKKMYCQLN